MNYDKDLVVILAPTLSECVHPRAFLGAQDSCGRDEPPRCVDRFPTLTNATRQGSIETSTAILHSHRVAVHRLRQYVRQQPTPLVATAPTHRTNNEATRRRKVISNRLSLSCVSYSMDFFVARISRVRSAETSTLVRSLDDEDKATTVSLTHVQTHYRMHRRFFSKRFHKNCQEIIRFFYFFFESVHTNCVWTQLPQLRRPTRGRTWCLELPSGHRLLIESPRRAATGLGSRRAEKPADI